MHFEAVGLSAREAFLAAAVTAMVGCALASFFLAGRGSERTHVALAMLIALIVLGLVGLFKLMNQFEIRRRPRR